MAETEACEQGGDAVPPRRCGHHHDAPSVVPATDIGTAQASAGVEEELGPPVVAAPVGVGDTHGPSEGGLDLLGRGVGCHAEDGPRTRGRHLPRARRSSHTCSYPLVPVSCRKSGAGGRNTAQVGRIGAKFSSTSVLARIADAAAALEPVVHQVSILDLDPSGR